MGDITDHEAELGGRPKLPGRFIDRLTSAQRKEYPMATGLIDYAPDALAAVSHISYVGNQKHNAGQPLHHARGKSMDHADCQVRHLSTRSSPDPAYAGDPIEEVSHLAQKAWRAIMELQEAMEAIYGLDLAPGARRADVATLAPIMPYVDLTKFDGLVSGDQFVFRKFDMEYNRKVEGDYVVDMNGDWAGSADEPVYQKYFERYIVKVAR